MNSNLNNLIKFYTQEQKVSVTNQLSQVEYIWKKINTLGIYRSRIGYANTFGGIDRRSIRRWLHAKDRKYPDE